jgi:hypothetical protein
MRSLVIGMSLAIRSELFQVILHSWGPIPWLYPPEVFQRSVVLSLKELTSWKDPSTHRPCERCLSLHCDKLGIQLLGWRSYALFARGDNLEVISDAWFFLRL